MRNLVILALASLLLAATAANAAETGIVTMVNGNSPNTVEITEGHLIIDGPIDSIEGCWRMYSKYPVNGVAKIVENMTVISGNSSTTFWRYTDIYVEDTPREDIIIYG